MCQDNSKRFHGKTIKCYRVYKVRHGNLLSYYNEVKMPAMGIQTRKMDAGPFHAFRNRNDVIAWFKNYYDRDSFRVVECQLEKHIQVGRWGDDDSVKTCTGDVLTVVREVGTYTHREPAIDWTA
jgi:hypothetical protein